MAHAREQTATHLDRRLRRERHWAKQWQRNDECALIHQLWCQMMNIKSRLIPILDNHSQSGRDFWFPTLRYQKYIQRLIIKDSHSPKRIEGHFTSSVILTGSVGCCCSRVGSHKNKKISPIMMATFPFLSATKLDLVIRFDRIYIQLGTRPTDSRNSVTVTVWSMSREHCHCMVGVALRCYSLNGHERGSNHVFL